MDKPLFSTSAGAGTPTATYAAVGTLLIHAVVLAGLCWVEVGESGEQHIEAPQLQLRKGEQAIEVRLRPVQVELLPQGSELTPPSPLSETWPTDSLSLDHTPRLDLPLSYKAEAHAAPSKPTTIAPVDVSPTSVRPREIAQASETSEVKRPSNSPEQAFSVNPSTLDLAVVMPELPQTFQKATDLNERDDPVVERPVSGITSGVKIQSIPKPIYPSLSRRRGEQGTVLLRIEIRKDGSTGTIQIIQNPGHERLVKAAISAARKGRFSPAMKNGQPVSSRVTVPFQFVLSG